ncbi:MAG: hypothetical protein PWP23_1602 [Candidatus Sumerlaeota bacterium]|nr:hypothetical protein [Candidatus Sumerlaeota bacterium]
MQRQPTAQRRGRAHKGAALLIVLWVLVLLSIILTNFAITVSTNARVAANAADAAELQAIAEGGVEHAIAVLSMDTRGVDSSADAWYFSESEFQNVTLGAGTYTLDAFDANVESSGHRPGIEDEASKLNLRTATREKLQTLGGLTPEQIDALLDWQDGDAETNPLGAESSTYRALPENPHPAKDRPLDTVVELQLLNAFDPTVLWGEDLNSNGILDPAEDDGDANPPNDNRDGVLDRGILPYVTVWSNDMNKTADGKDRVNINEASEEELKASIPSLTDEEAKAIVEHRDSSRFEKVGELLKVKKPKKEEEKTDESQQNGEQESSDTSGNTNQEAPQSTQNNAGDSGEQRENMFSRERVKQIIGFCKIDNEPAKAGRININTAPVRVLKTVPGIDEQRAQAILLARNEGRSFETIAGLLDVAGISEENFIEASEEITVKSDQFFVRSTARIEGVKRLAVANAVIDRSAQPIKILYWNAE